MSKQAQTNLKYQPRHDFVVFRMVERGIVRGVVLPDIARDSKRLVVEAIGPEVEDLKIGDVILALGQLGVEYSQLPHEKDLFLIRETSVALVIKEVE